jgi:hypothetical protein
MASCFATQGFPLDCKTVGGVTAIYLVESTAVSASRLTIVSGSVTNTGSFLSTGKMFYLYAQHTQQADWTEQVKSNPANQSIEVDEKLTFTLFKSDVNKRNEAMNLAGTDVVALVTLNDSTSWLVGSTFVAGAPNPLGLNFEGSYSSGKNFTDKNGWNYTVSGQSTAPAYQVSASLIAALTVAAP